MEFKFVIDFKIKILSLDSQNFFRQISEFFYLFFQGLIRSFLSARKGNRFAAFAAMEPVRAAEKRLLVR